MGKSLNEIAENLAFALGDQFNFTLREAIKHTVCIYREKLLREEDFNSSINYNDFRQKIIMPLEDWDSGDCLKGKITKDILPTSIRFKSRGRVNYYYVGGEKMNEPFTQTTFTEYEFIKNLPYQIAPIFYIIEEDKLILPNQHKRCKISISGVFTEPQLLKDICENVEEVDDNASFPISGDMIAIIRKGILSGDFPIRQQEEQDIVTLNSNKE